MKPIQFKEQNTMLKKPEEMSDEECGTLPVFTDGSQCVSCWELSDEEIESIRTHKKIWVGILTNATTQPPMWLSAEETVFTKQ